MLTFSQTGSGTGGCNRGNFDLSVCQRGDGYGGNRAAEGTSNFFRAFGITGRLGLNHTFIVDMVLADPLAVGVGVGICSAVGSGQVGSVAIEELCRGNLYRCMCVCIFHSDRSVRGGAGNFNHAAALAAGNGCAGRGGVEATAGFQRTIDIQNGISWHIGIIFPVHILNINTAAV